MLVSRRDKCSVKSKYDYLKDQHYFGSINSLAEVTTFHDFKVLFIFNGNSLMNKIKHYIKVTVNTKVNTPV